MPLTIRSILVSTDLSPVSDEVVRAAADLASHTGAELHVLHAVEPSRAPNGEAVLRMQRRIHEARTALHEQLRDVPPQVRLASVRAVFGRASAAILNRAEELDASLIVIGPHRVRPFGDQVLGSTADQLIGQSRIPCMIARGRLPLPVRRLVVPTDLSEVARGTATVAIRWARALRGSAVMDRPTEVTLVHVDSSTAPDPFDVAARYSVWSQMERHAAEAVSGAGHGASVLVDQEILHAPYPAPEILRYAGEAGADLLVMGTRGDPPLMKTLLASVSAAVARTSSIPLLLVPPAVWRAEHSFAATPQEEAVSALSAPTA